MGATNETMGEWKAGSVFGCFNDISSCCYGYCCFPCAYGSVSDKVDGSCVTACLLANFCTLCTVCCIAPGRRKTIRDKLALDEAPCSDCITWVCCPTCANCQEARELKLRNINSRTDFDSSGAAAGGAA